MAAMHKATCTRPGCGLACSSASVDEVMAWSEAHDQHCPSLKAQEIAPRLLAEAEKRGAVKALRKFTAEADDLIDNAKDSGELHGRVDSIAIAADLIGRIESGEVTL